MEVLVVEDKGELTRCYACLGSNVAPYTCSDNSVFKDIFNGSVVLFCLECESLARQTDDFLQNCRQVQKLLQEQKSQLLKLEECNPKDEGDGNDESTLVEVKRESEKHDDSDFDVTEEATPLENDFKQLLDKDEIKLEIEECKPVKTLRRKGKSSPKPKVKCKPGKPRLPKISRVILTPAEMLNDRTNRANKLAYINSNYKCEPCIKGFFFEERYQEHMRLHDERLTTFTGLRWHRQTHNTRYKCNACGQTWANNGTASEHYTNTHELTDNGDEFYCDKCPKRFTKKSNLRKHIAYKHHDKEYLCNMCNKRCCSKYSLTTHLVTKHGDPGSRPVKIQPYKCSHCPKSYRAPSMLAKHMISHGNERKHYCVECDKYFKSECILKAHLSTAKAHATPNTLRKTCTECGEKFADVRKLERHFNREHNKNKPYPCEYCPKAFLTQSDLRQHYKVVHDQSARNRERVFTCSMCDKSFARKCILKSHVRTHTGERPYECNICSATFAQSSTLGTHVRLIHGRKKLEQRT